MSVFDALTRWSIDPQQRDLVIHFGNTALNAQVFLQRIDGRHAINDGLNASLFCLSDHAELSLKQFIGTSVCVNQRTDHGQWHRTSGIITHAERGQSDGALTAYTLTLQDPSALFKQRRNSRVFINKSVLDISQVLFSEWQSRSRLFAACLSLDMQGVQSDCAIRPFIMQHNETDHNFLTRLWRSEGINWLADESQNLTNFDDTALQPQILRLIDHNRYYKQLERKQIAYHPNSQQTGFNSQPYDHLTQLTAQHHISNELITTQHWQPQQQVTQQQSAFAHAPLQANQSQSKSLLSSTASLTLESAWSLGSAWVGDLDGADGVTLAGNQHLEKLSVNLRDYQASQASTFSAIGNVRDSQAGYWFRLTTGSIADAVQSHLNQSSTDDNSADQAEFVIIAKQFYQQNNLPAHLNQQVSQLIGQGSGFQSSGHQGQTGLVPDALNLGRERYGSQLTLIPRDVVIKPEYHPLQHRPPAYAQRARVVGPAGESIYVDAWGRIKVQFLFTRMEDHTHSGGAGSSGTDGDSGWVDVAIPWAGDSSDANYGARFLPRIGELVIINFLDGNIDRPFVAGRLHEGSRLPAQFDQLGQLPDTRALSGIKSQEIKADGFNQLRFDDTIGQISAQLASSHATSQLNLGNLSHPKQSDTSLGRGEGFELRSDQFGAVRAGKGLLLTTHGQPQAQGHHLDTATSKQQLESGLNSSEVLSDIAKNQQTDPLDTLDNLKSFIEQIEQQDTSSAAAFKSALMILSAPASIALSTQQDIHLSASQQISHSAGGSINLSTQNNLIAHASNKISLFAAQKGISAIAAKSKIKLQAQDDAIELIARKVIQIISTEDSIHLTSVKEIVLNASGSQIKINGGGVFITTGAKFECKAAQHVFSGGEKTLHEMPLLPNTPSFSNRLDIYDLFWQSDFSQLSYKAFISNSSTCFSGKIDKHGRTGKIPTIDSSKVQVLIGSDNEWGLSVEGFDQEDFHNNENNEEIIENNNNEKGEI